MIIERHCTSAYMKLVSPYHVYTCNPEEPEQVGGNAMLSPQVTQAHCVCHIGKYREHTRRSLGPKICSKMEIKIDQTYHVVSCCCPSVKDSEQGPFFRKLLVHIKDSNSSPHGKFRGFYFQSSLLLK